jgi:Uma2 family endonuclease
MPSALKSPYLSEADYLSAETSAIGKSEYASGQVFALAGTSIRHNQISGHIFAALHANATKHCRVFIADVKFKAHQLYYYPDVMVACVPNTDRYRETQPCLIIEVLSDSTAAIDLGEKMHHYQRVAELQNYVLVSQSERRVDVYTRAGAFWRFENIVDEGDIELSCPAMKLSLDAIYADQIAAGQSAA